MTIHRRDTLKLVGAAATAAIAGCSDAPGLGSGGGDDPDPPAYSDWLTTDDDALVYASLEWSALEEFQSDGGEDEDPIVDDENAGDDPMIGLPTGGLVAVGLAGSFGLAAFGLSGLVALEGQQGGSEFDSSVEKMVLANEAFVVTGDLETDELDDRLTGESQSMFSQQYEQTETIGDYDVYTPVSGERNAIAISEDALVFAVDSDAPVDVIRAPIEASAGDTERATAEHEDLAWLAATGGDGHLVLGLYGDPESPVENQTGNESAVRTEDDYEVFADASGVVSSLTFESETKVTGDLAAVVADPDEETLEEVVGSTATEGSVEVDGDRVTASATWEKDA